MVVSDKINIISPNTNFPVEWCRIFAECVQNVENRLGVPLNARVGGKSNCIFVLPKEISLESIENLTTTRIGLITIPILKCIPSSE